MFAKRFIVCAGLLCIARGPVHAQPAPANVRDGCVTGAAVGDVDLFTVPAGMEFVLTDLQYEVGGNATVQVVDDLGTLRWLVFGLDTPPTRNRSWATGIHFSSSQIVRARIANGGPFPYTFCWSGYVAPTSMTSVPTEAAESFGLKIGPNPTGSGATISFRLARGGPVALGIYDAGGRLVRRLQSGFMPPGDQQVRWDGSDRKGRSVDAGVYFARLETATERRNTKIVRTN